MCPNCWSVTKRNDVKHAEVHNKETTAPWAREQEPNRKWKRNTITERGKRERAADADFTGTKDQNRDSCWIGQIRVKLLPYGNATPEETRMKMRRRMKSRKVWGSMQHCRWLCLFTRAAEGMLLSGALFTFWAQLVWHHPSLFHSLPLTHTCSLSLPNTGTLPFLLLALTFSFSSSSSVCLSFVCLSPSFHFHFITFFFFFLFLLVLLPLSNSVSLSDSLYLLLSLSPGFMLHFALHSEPKADL